FVTLLPIVIRYVMEAFSGVLFSDATVRNLIPALRLTLFGALIIVFLMLEPEGLNRLWRNIRSYFRVWPFAYGVRERGEHHEPLRGYYDGADAGGEQPARRSAVLRTVQGRA